MLKTGRFPRSVVAAAVLSVFLPASAAWAAATPWQDLGPSKVRLLAVPDREKPGEVLLGLHFRLQPGWKTYWRDPGQAGAPPRLSWQGSDNMGGFEVKWPAPKRFTAFGFDSFGYEKELLLPIRADRPAAGKSSEASLQLDFLVCGKICMPQQAEFSLKLPQKLAAGAGELKLVERFLAAVPPVNGKAPLTVSDARLVLREGVEWLVLKAQTRTLFGKPDVMVEGTDADFDFAAPSASYTGGRREVTLRLPVRPLGKGKSVIGRDLTITIVDDSEAVEFRFSPKAYAGDA